MDETDIGLFPHLDEVEHCLNFVVPSWAVQANKQPSIILFDELNRAQLPIRNAALQILLDRRIGWDFKFNDEVLMFSAGNQGEQDGCDVEEFDAALWGRLIHVKHSLTLDEWIEGYAKQNVWDVIISYLKAYPQELYKRSENTKVYASHRSWTFLSDLVKCHFDGFQNADTQKVKTLLEQVGGDYIGNGITKFIRYLEDLSIVNATDILNRYDQVEDQIKTFNRAKLTELLTALKEFEFKKFKKNQLENLAKFIGNLHDDEAVSYLIFLVDSCEVDDIKDFIQRYPKLRKVMKNNYNLDA
jgi:hypothetical protein